jgi:hypothetical protein
VAVYADILDTLVSCAIHLRDFLDEVLSLSSAQFISYWLLSSNDPVVSSILTKSFVLCLELVLEICIEIFCNIFWQTHI